MVVVERQVDARSEGRAQHFVRLHIAQQRASVATGRGNFGGYGERTPRCAASLRREGVALRSLSSEPVGEPDYSGHAMRSTAARNTLGAW